MSEHKLCATHARYRTYKAEADDVITIVLDAKYKECEKCSKENLWTCVHCGGPTKPYGIDTHVSGLSYTIESATCYRCYKRRRAIERNARRSKILKRLEELGLKDLPWLIIAETYFEDESGDAPEHYP